MPKGTGWDSEVRIWTWLKSLFITIHYTLRNLKAGTINLPFYLSTCPPFHSSSHRSLYWSFLLSVQWLTPPCSPPHQSSSHFYSLAIHLAYPTFPLSFLYSVFCPVISMSSVHSSMWYLLSNYEVQSISLRHLQQCFPYSNGLINILKLTSVNDYCQENIFRLVLPLFSTETIIQTCRLI